MKAIVDAEGEIIFHPKTSSRPPREIAAAVVQLVYRDAIQHSIDANNDWSSMFCVDTLGISKIFVNCCLLQVLAYLMQGLPKNSVTY